MMRKRDEPRARPRVGRMIAWTAVCAVLCWGATLYMVRAVAQEAPPDAPTTGVPADVPAGDAPSDDAPPTDAVGADTNEEIPADAPRGGAAAEPEEIPEYRDSADNNISLPVDI